MHTKRSLEAVAALSALGVLVSGEATFVQFSRSAIGHGPGTLLGLPLGLYDFIAFGLVFLVAASALWRRVAKVMMP
ncbi:MAG TPA: hypothetical protein VGI83_00965 [Gemmatimonadales bacterium]|jgi:hypothetical protein